MADSSLQDSQFPQPFVVNSRGAKTLHFSIATIQSRMRLDDPFALDLAYTRTMMGCLLFVPDPRRIAMIGLGGGSLAKFCQRHLPAATIDVVEINPHVIALRDEFCVPPDDHRFKITQGDGARWVRQHDLALDVLMIDGFDPAGLPEALGTQRFDDDCFEALRPGGLLVMNLHRGDPRYDILIDRLRRSFNDALFTVDDDDRSNSIVFATKGRAFAQYKPGIVRPPAGLDAEVADELLGAFAQVVGALKRQRLPIPDATDPGDVSL
jgi:spermidine synthase